MMLFCSDGSPVAPLVKCSRCASQLASHRDVVWCPSCEWRGDLTESLLDRPSDEGAIVRAAVERSERLAASLRAVLDHVVDTKGYMTAEQQEILREARRVL